MPDPISLTDARKAQLDIFKKRVQPRIDLITEGVDVKRGRVLKKLVDHPPAKWADTVSFAHPKIPDITLWDSFYGNFLQYCDFKANPLENEAEFTKELHAFVERVNGSELLSNRLTIRRESPLSEQNRPRMELARGDEKFDSEKYPHVYRLEFSLEWIVK